MSSAHTDYYMPVEELAFHEAAHAVVAAAFGRTIRSATIVREGDYLGRVRYSQAAPDGGLAEPMARWIVFFAEGSAISLAGPCAEIWAREYPQRRKLGRGARRTLATLLTRAIHDGWSKDVSDFMAPHALRSLYDDEAWREYIESVVALVADSWSQITRIAHALIRLRTLNENDMAVLLASPAQPAPNGPATHSQLVQARLDLPEEAR